MKSAFILLVVVNILTVAQMYPILIHGSDLNRVDLFLNQDQLAERLENQQSKAIKIYNIYTHIDKNDIFIRSIKNEIFRFKTLSGIFQKSFVSQYIDSNPRELYNILRQSPRDLDLQFQSLNVQKLGQIEQEIQQLSDSKQLDNTILLFQFTKIISNSRILQDNANVIDLQLDQNNNDTLSLIQAPTAIPVENHVYDMSSTTIAGYLVFFSCLFTGYIMISCMGDIKTPERFVRTNFHFGKEN